MLHTLRRVKGVPWEGYDAYPSQGKGFTLERICNIPVILNGGRNLEYEEKMGQIYHHTTFDVLKKIVQKEGLEFRASRYSNYGDEYDWIKEKADCVVQEICKEKNIDYEKNSMEYVHYIICFCKEHLLKRMWDRYAGYGEGIQIGIDISICYNKSLSDENPDTFNECVYMTDEEVSDMERLKTVIQEIDERSLVETDKKQDDWQINVSFIKQKKYEYEKEYRYMIPYYYASIFSLDNNNLKEDKSVDFDSKIFNRDDIRIDEDKRYCYLSFPKEALKSIILGYKTTDEQLKEVRKYLEDCGYNLGQISIRKVEEAELK